MGAELDSTGRDRSDLSGFHWKIAFVRGRDIHLLAKLLHRTFELGRGHVPQDRPAPLERCLPSRSGPGEWPPLAIGRASLPKWQLPPADHERSAGEAQDELLKLVPP